MARPRGSDTYDDTALLRRMAEGIRKGEFKSPHAAAAALASEAEGQPDAAKRRLYDKYRKRRRELEGSSSHPLGELGPTLFQQLAKRIGSLSQEERIEFLVDYVTLGQQATAEIQEIYRRALRRGVDLRSDLEQARHIVTLVLTAHVEAAVKRSFGELPEELQENAAQSAESAEELDGGEGKPPESLS